MTIFQIGQYPLDSAIIRGGIEASVYGLTQEQSLHNKVFVLDVPRMGINDCIEKCNNTIIYRFNNPGPHQKDAVKRVGKYLEVILQNNPSICHIHGTSFFSWLLYKALKDNSIPVVVTVHGLVAIEKKKALKQHFSLKTIYQFIIQGHYEKKLLSNIGSVIVDTPYVRKAIEEYKLKHRPNSYVIPQGIDEQFFSLTCSPSSKTVLAVGSISRRKGHLLLLEAFNEAAKIDKELKLVICGIKSDVSYYNELINFISSLPCKERIKLLIDVPKADILSLYQQAHVFALHSQEESQGIVFAEAMATGLPIVATRVGGIPDVVEDRVNGFLSEYGDTLSFSKHLTKAMSDRFDWSSMSDNCKKKSFSYSWHQLHKRIDNVYSIVINK